MYSLQSYCGQFLVNVVDCTNNARNEEYQIGKSFYSEAVASYIPLLKFRSFKFP